MQEILHRSVKQHPPIGSLCRAWSPHSRRQQPRRASRPGSPGPGPRVQVPGPRSPGPGPRAQVPRPRAWVPGPGSFLSRNGSPSKILAHLYRQIAQNRETDTMEPFPGLKTHKSRNTYKNMCDLCQVCDTIAYTWTHNCQWASISKRVHGPPCKTMFISADVWAHGSVLLNRPCLRKTNKKHGFRSKINLLRMFC